MPPPPQLQPGEKWTNLYSVSYDYQTNGSIRYFVQDPTSPGKMCAILMAQQDSNSSVGVARYIYYSYSEDYGNTWTPDGLEITTPWGFADMALRNGVPIISAHRFNTGISVFQDIFFGAFGFSQIQGLPLGTNWPHLAGTANGNIVVVGSPNDGVFVGQYTTYNGTSWSPNVPLPLVGGPSGNFSVEAGSNGIVGIFGTNYLGNGGLYWYKSTDNGNTFDNGSLIFDYILDGGDTLFANIVGGLQAHFVNTEPHVVFAAYNISPNVFPDPNTTQFIKPKIFHWSQTTGLSQVAGKFNIPNMTDTITTLLFAPIGQPSIGSLGGGKLACTFTVFLRGNTQIVQDGSVLNAGEVFYSVSNDNGITWGMPVNITNTPAIEEKHSSLLRQNNSDSLKVYYLRDMRAGGWVNNPAWGKAPVYGIFKKNAITVGIQQISSEVKSFELYQNYPNPFNPSTKIKFNIPKSNFTSLIIYDINGREIRRLVNEKLNTGIYEYDFSASDYGLSSGVYYYKLIAGEYVDTKKMILLK